MVLALPSQYLEAFFAVGGLFVGGIAAVPLVLAGFAVAQTRESAQWQDNGTFWAFAVGALVTAGLFWPGAYAKWSCDQLAEDDGRYSISNYVEARNAGCFDD